METETGCKFFKTDVTDEENVKKLFEFVKGEYNNVHIVVNSAGVGTPGSIIYSKGVL